MAVIIAQPSLIEASGTKPKIIKEFIGRVNSDTGDLSVAMMESPEGWVEPGQTPEFDEYTVILEGTLHVKTKDKVYVVAAGQAVIATKGEWVQYSTPDTGGAKYVAVCHPAFSPDTVRRDAAG